MLWSVMHFFNTNNSRLQNSSTQTSKTVLQLAVQELENLYKKNNLKAVNEKLYPKYDTRSSSRSPKSYQEIYVNRKDFLRSTSPMSQILSQRQTQRSNANQEITKTELFSISSLSNFLIKRIRIKPVSSVSQESNKISLNISGRASPNQKTSREPSPQNTETQHPSNAEHNMKIPKISNNRQTDNEQSNVKEEINQLISQMKCSDWNVALAALKHIAHISEKCDQEIMFPYMPEINQRLIQLIQSPRSHVCRTSCQISGRLFQTVGDTRRPEFDDIVDLLLGRTADANRFIKIDANEALMNMVNSIPPYHSVRSLCNKGTKHKNDLVRMATARLFVRIVNLCGIHLLLNPGGNEFTRKRIISNMTNFLNDKNVQVRHYGEELRKLLSQHPNFEYFIKECVDSRYRSERVK